MSAIVWSGPKEVMPGSALAALMANNVTATNAAYIIIAYHSPKPSASLRRSIHISGDHEIRLVETLSSAVAGSYRLIVLCVDDRA